jgi:LiaF transmembrane domain
VRDRQGRSGGIVAGGILVVLGVLFLVRDRIDIDWGLVWPFFLIVPGAYVFARAIFTRDHRDRTGGFIGGAILLFLGGVFLLQNYYALDWQKVWPFFLIIPGVGLLVGAFLGWGRRDQGTPPGGAGTGVTGPPPSPGGTPPAAG